MRNRRSFDMLRTDSGNVNQFSKNLQDSIYSRTGSTPIIRLGGTSADYGKYLPGQSAPALPVAEQNNYQNVGGSTIGPGFWQTAAKWPEGKYMVQVPLANANISEPVAWAKAAVSGLGLDRIHSIQLGNEPNLYSNNYQGATGFLGPPKFQGTLTNATWVGNYTKYAAAVRAAVSVPDNFFTAFDTAFTGRKPCRQSMGSRCRDMLQPRPQQGEYCQRGIPSLIPRKCRQCCRPQGRVDDHEQNPHQSQLLAQTYQLSQGQPSHDSFHHQRNWQLP